jgi:ketosteroid isomerase-like protein
MSISAQRRSGGSVPTRRIWLSALILGLSAVAVPAPRAAAQPVDRAAVVRQFFAAWSRGDVEATMALVAEDVTFVGGAGCPPQRPCQGAPALRALVEADVALHSTFTVTDSRAAGSAVVSRLEVRQDPVRAAGAERAVATSLAQVPRDRIAAYVGYLDLTDAQTAAALGLPAPAAPSLPGAFPATGDRTGAGDGPAA